MALNLEPASGVFPASGGNAKHNIVSLSDSRLAFKVHPLAVPSLSWRFLQTRASGEVFEQQRVKPVVGFIEPKASAELEIIRLSGPPKQDKLAVQWAEVPAEEQDPKAPFAAGAQAGEVILPLKAE